MHEHGGAAAQLAFAAEQIRGSIRQVVRWLLLAAAGFVVWLMVTAVGAVADDSNVFRVIVETYVSLLALIVMVTGLVRAAVFGVRHLRQSSLSVRL